MNTNQPSIVDTNQRDDSQANDSRRDFLKGSAAVGAGLALGANLNFVHGGVQDTIRVGLVGCGGRGTGAAKDAMDADKGVKLVAMGDAFADRLASSRQQLRNIGGKQFDVPDDRCFVGIDAYKRVIEQVDVVLLCTPPHFRPAQLQEAVAQGKHVFAEKPVAVDAPGVRAVLASCAEAKKKNLSIVSGLCWRYHNGMRETVQRVTDGTIGKIVAMQCNYNAGGLWSVPRRDGWSDIEWQMRNWLYFTWLSGDHNVEQHIHSLDKMAWVMGDEYPVRAVGLGGRQSRTQPEFGHIFDHHAVVYEFANGVRCFAYCRQQQGTDTDVSDWIFGSKGTANLMEHTITGENKWQLRRKRGERADNMYLQEHQALFAAIRAGKPINNGEYMTKSTLMAIMGRMATYTGKIITWDKAFHSQENLSPKSYNFGPNTVPEVARPGITPFV